MKRKAINLCVQHAYQSEKSCLEAQESHVNSLKPHVESNFGSLHSYLDQNETVKNKYCSFPIHSRSTRYYNYYIYIIINY